MLQMYTGSIPNVLGVWKLKETFFFFIKLTFYLILHDGFATQFLFISYGQPISFVVRKLVSILEALDLIPGQVCHLYHISYPFSIQTLRPT